MGLKMDQVNIDKYDAIYAKLIEVYGQPAWRQHLPPVDELVSTILSQSTSDTNRDKGFNALKARYANWEDVLTAPTAEIIETIRPAGLANQKGPRIQHALQYICDRQGTISLDFLADLSLDEALVWLTNINGVGPKTAAIILLFAFGRPAFPVDTHVHRVTRRLGLIGPNVSAEKAHRIFANLDRPHTFYAMHLNLIRHGREVCQARNPRCGICPLQDNCHYFQHVEAGD